jgi:hypothetical protein
MHKGLASLSRVLLGGIAQQDQTGLDVRYSIVGVELPLFQQLDEGVSCVEPRTLNTANCSVCFGGIPRDVGQYHWIDLRALYGWAIGHPENL